MNPQKMAIAFFVCLSLAPLFPAAAVESRGRSGGTLETTQLPQNPSPTKPSCATSKACYEGLRWIYSTQPHKGYPGMDLRRGGRRVYGPGY